LAESPASIRRRVRPVATSVELPALEEARTETLTIVRPPEDYVTNIAFCAVVIIP